MSDEAGCSRVISLPSRWFSLDIDRSGSQVGGGTRQDRDPAACIDEPQRDRSAPMPSPLLVTNVARPDRAVRDVSTTWLVARKTVCLTGR